MSGPSESAARSFFESRRLAPRIWNDGSDVWVDLMNARTGSVVAPQYGRGTSEEDALSSAVARYRVEEADWDQSGIRIAMEFVPTTTTPPSLRQIVNTAFISEGVQVEDFIRPAAELEFERKPTDLKWGSPSLTVHLISDLPVDEIVRKVGVPIGLALSNVRRLVSDLPLGVIVERPDRRLLLAWRPDDSPDEITRSVERLPQDLEGRRTIGWDRERGVWFDL
jgi:hypothetical protein